MSGSFVIFARKASKNFILPLSKVRNKNVHDIIDIISQNKQILFKKDEEIIMISTPLYRETLQPDCNPVEIYPNLVSITTFKAYQRPEYYLYICPIEEQNIQFYNLNSTVQNNFHLPWEVPINPDEFNDQPSSVLCEYLLRKYPYQMMQSEPKSVLNSDGNEISSDISAKDMLNEMKSRMYSIQCSLHESELKKIKTRFNVIEEIRTSEIVYISRLLTIDKVIIPTFIENKVLSDPDYKKFDSIENISRVHSQFLSDLTLEINSYKCQISTIFLNFCDFFKIVKPYIENIDSIYKMMNHADKSKIDKILTMPELEGQNPMSFFIVPFQRVPKYRLFLSDLIKYTPRCHPDSIFLDQALTSIRVVLDDIQCSKEYADDQEKLFNIYQRLSKKVDILYPSRRLLEQFNVKIKTQGIVGIFYVFNDLIMLTSTPTNNDKLDVFYDSKITEFKYLDQKLQIDQISFHSESEHDKNCIVEFMDSGDKEKFIQLVESRRYEQYKELNQMEMFFMHRIQLPSLVLHSYNHASAMLGSYFFSFGGRGFVNLCMNVNSFFSPATKSWNIFIDPKGPQARSGHAIAVDDNQRVFLFGGECKGVYFNDLYVGFNNGQYQIVWEKIEQNEKDNVPEPREGHTLIFYKDELFLFGGRQKSFLFGDVWSYSLVENKWTCHVFECTPTPRYYHSACKCGPWMAIHGGINKKPFGDTCFFDMEAKKWVFFKVEGSAPCRYGHKSLYFNGYFIFFGGTNESSKIVPPTVINTKRDKEWVYQDFKLGGNEPITLFLFSLVHMKGPEFFIYGGIDPTSFKKYGQTSDEKSMNDMVSSSFYCVKLPKSISEDLSECDRLPVPAEIEAAQGGGWTFLRRRHTLGIFGKKEKKSTTGSIMSFIFKRGKASETSTATDSTGTAESSTKQSENTDVASSDNEGAGENGKSAQGMSTSDYESLVESSTSTQSMLTSDARSLGESNTSTQSIIAGENIGIVDDNKSTQSILASGNVGSLESVKASEESIIAAEQTKKEESPKEESKQESTDAPEQTKPEENTNTNEENKQEESTNATEQTKPEENANANEENTSATEQTKPEENTSAIGQTKPEESNDTNEESKQEESTSAAEETKPEENANGNEASKQEANTSAVEQAKPEESTNEIEQAKPEESTNEIEQAKPEENTNEIEQAKPEENTNTNEESKQKESTNATEQTKPEENTNEIEQTKPEESTNATEQTKPEESTNTNEENKQEESTNATEETKPEENANGNEASTSAVEQAKPEESTDTNKDTNKPEPKEEAKPSNLEPSPGADEEAELSAVQPVASADPKVEIKPDASAKPAAAASSIEKPSPQRNARLAASSSAGQSPQPKFESQSSSSSVNDDTDYVSMAREINIDSSKLLPFQKKQLEQKLRNYNALVRENNALLDGITGLTAIAEEMAFPQVDVFVKIFDQQHRKKHIVKISSSTTFDEFYAVLVDRVKFTPNEKISRFMNIYPITKYYFNFAINEIVLNRISHISVYVS